MAESAADTAAKQAARRAVYQAALPDQPDRTKMPHNSAPGFSDAVASFLSRIGNGIQVVMTTSWLADEIAECDEPEEPLYAYIKDNFLCEELSAVGAKRFWFSEDKFSRMLEKISERPRIAEALNLLEDHGVSLESVIDESCCVENDFEDQAVPVYKQIKRSIARSKTVVTFAQLFDSAHHTA